MFFSDGIIKRSSLLTAAGTAHGFSTKLGGVSSHPYTREMNLAKGREDADDVVIKNIDIFASAVSSGKYSSRDVVTAGQIHSSKVRYVTESERGEGVVRAAGEECDGFVTDRRGVMPIIRVADCVPILLCAAKEYGSPVVGAVHAGWRGTVSGIAAEAIELMKNLGAEPSSFKIAIGAHIMPCCFTVGEDFLEAVKAARGGAFAEKFIFFDGSSLRADLTGMNIEIIKDAGIDKENIDFSEDCTSCRSDLYHSHRKTGGKRGAMGAGIVIL